ncbi:MAG: DUF423 domain-containing protein [Chromatiales bacterium]
MNPSRQQPVFVLIAAIAGFFSVALGAFAAHGLKQTMPADLLTVFQTGVHYQAIHALALLYVSILPKSRSISVAGWSFVIGMLLFSGSLYLLATTGMRTLGMITPFGGVSFLVGWLALALYAWGAWRKPGSA